MAARAAALVLLCCFALSFGLSSEAAGSSQQKSQVLQRHHLEITSALVLKAEIKAAGPAPAPAAIEHPGAVAPAAAPHPAVGGAPAAAAAASPAAAAGSKKASEDEDDNDDEEDDDDEEEPVVKQGRKAKLEQAVKDIEGKLAGNQAEQDRIKAKLAHLENNAKSTREITKMAKKVSKETGTKAMGPMMAHMFQELRMFELPEFTKHVAAELALLNEDKKDLEIKHKKAKADLAAYKEMGKKWEEQGADEVVEKKSKKQSQSVSGDQVKLPKIVMPNLPNFAMPKIPHGDTNSINFWRMAAAKQESVLMGTLAYLVFGVLCAYLYKQARHRYPKTFTPEARPHVFPSEVGFSFGLFDCFADAKLCVIGCCCPFLRWADTVDQKHLLPYWRAFVIMFSLLLLHVYTWGLSDIVVVILGVYYRQKLRRQFMIENGTPKSLLNDTLAWLCCQPCAVIQEAREDVVARGLGV